MTLNTIKTVIFDNDGVNINSEDLAMRICDDWIVNLVEQFIPQQPMPQDYIYNNFAGKSTNKIVDAVIRERGLPLDAMMAAYDLSETKLAHIKAAQNLSADDTIGAVSFALADLITLETIARFKQELKAIPGITEAHEEIRELVGAENVIMATTSRADRMDASTEGAVDPVTGKNARLAEFFPVGLQRISGYGLPNKYDYAFSLYEKNGTPIDTDGAIVIEDSISGVKYAKANRPEVRVIGTVAADFYIDKVGHARALLEAGASVVISNARDLPAVIKWLDSGLDISQKPENLEGAVYTPADFQIVQSLSYVASSNLGGLNHMPA